MFPVIKKIDLKILERLCLFICRENIKSHTHAHTHTQRERDARAHACIHTQTDITHPHTNTHIHTNTVLFINFTVLDTFVSLRGHFFFTAEIHLLLQFFTIGTHRSRSRGNFEKNNLFSVFKNSMIPQISHLLCPLPMMVSKFDD